MFKKLLILVSASIIFSASCVADDALPDPTRPLEYTVGATQNKSLQLNSILISQNRKIAVINGVQLSENQWLDDKRVVSIRDNSVTLDYQGQKIVLSLHNKKIRR